MISEYRAKHENDLVFFQLTVQPDPVKGKLRNPPVVTAQLALALSRLLAVVTLIHKRRMRVLPALYRIWSLQ